MPRFRFSIASMMMATLAVALGFAALRSNSIASVSILLLATLALLCGSILMSLVEKGPGRLPWLGIAAFGWPCFLVGFGPLANEGMGPLRLTLPFEQAIPCLNDMAAGLPSFLRYRYASQAIGDALGRSLAAWRGWTMWAVQRTAQSVDRDRPLMLYCRSVIIKP